ncbi:MAG: phosphotransferase [Terrimonas sp.]|nr:phosphotransferase [Terrimonas sp.]
MLIPDQVQSMISELLNTGEGPSSAPLYCTPVSGGSINNCYRVSSGKEKDYFLKLNRTDALPGLYKKEQAGLLWIEKQDAIRVPAVIKTGTHGDFQFLLMEWLEPGLRTEKFWASFGSRLARLHSLSHSAFGFPEDNYMGALPQVNGYMDKWEDFYIHNRLMPQVKLAVDNKLIEETEALQFEKLYKRLTGYFEPENPALLHGDLWSGNFICDSNSEPVLIDPAVYYGHRSIDLAMTKLFGGFDKLFYESYHYHYPLPANYQEQWDICQLYPLLIHLNLFGRGYLQEIKAILKKYI